MRIGWALEGIAPKPSDRLLEIGCGQGLAVAAVCEGLTSGTILAIDRSATMIAAARRRNRDHERERKAAFATKALAEMAFGPQRFDKVLAINVNLFWRDRETVARLETGGFSGAVVRKGTGTTARPSHVSAA